MLPAGSALLFLAACDGTSAPTAPVSTVVPRAATSAASATTPASILVRGLVVDSSNRPLANAQLECPGPVRCASPNERVSAEGHDHHATTTDTNGAYAIVATDLSAGSASGFLMNANGRGYLVDWRQLEWPVPACTSDEARCAVTVNFTLTPAPD